MTNNITVILTPEQLAYIITCVDSVRLKSSARKLGDAIIETLIAASDENNSQKV